MSAVDTAISRDSIAALRDDLHLLAGCRRELAAESSDVDWARGLHEGAAEAYDKSARFLSLLLGEDTRPDAERQR